MSDFYEAEYSQSRLFHGSISSFPYIIQKWQDDPITVASKTRDVLNVYLGKYFDNCEVQMTSDELPNSVSYNLRSFVSVTQDGKTVNLWEQVKVTGTQFERSLVSRE